MGKNLQLRRGLKTNIPNLELAEPGYSTDTKELHIGNGDGTYATFLNQEITNARISELDTSAQTQIDDLNNQEQELVKLDGESQASVNFKENQVIQDGLLFLDTKKAIYNSASKYNKIIDLPNSRFDILLSFKMIQKSVQKEYCNIFLIDRDFRELVWTVRDADRYFLGKQRKEQSPFFKMRLTYFDGVYTLTDSQGVFNQRIFNKSISNFHLFNGLVSTEYATYELDYFAIYDRMLSPEEIAHNLQVLNNEPSIDALTINNQDYKFSSDSNLITMQNQATLEEAYEGLARTMTKEFVSSDGSDIVIDNAIENSKILDLEISGRTAKNEFLNCFANKNYFDKRSGGFDQAAYSDNNGYHRFTRHSIIVIGDDGTGANIKPNTVYTLLCDFKDIVHLEGSIYLSTNYLIEDKYVFTSNVHITSTTISKDKNEAFLKFKLTTKSTIPNDAICLGMHTSGLNSSARFDFKLRMALVEGDYTQSDIINSTFIGLTSTKAIINNNGLEYKYYEPIIEGETKIVDANGNECAPGTTGARLQSLAPSDPSLPELKSVNAIATILDLNKNIVLENVKNLVFNGEEVWGMHWEKDNTVVFLNRSHIKDKKAGSSNIISNIFITHGGSVSEIDYECIAGNSVYGDYVYIRINKNRLDTVDINGFKKWLSQNPITVVYELLTPEVVQLTEEQIKAYSQHVKVLELNSVKNERQAALVTERLSNNFVNKFFKKTTLFVAGISDIAILSNGCRRYTLTTNLKNAVVDAPCCSDKLNCDNRDIAEREYFKVDTLVSYYYVLSTDTRTKNEIMTYLNNLRATILYQTSSRVEYVNSNIISLQESNNISIGSDVKPSSYKITAPVNKIKENQTRIDAIKAKNIALASLLTEQ